MSLHTSSAIVSGLFIAGAAYAQCPSSNSSSGCDGAIETTTAQLASYDHHAGKNIVETAIDAGSFDTLVAAVKAAGVADTLSGPGPFTVFAPSDAAFAKLPAGTVQNLLKPENKDLLTSILTYHVVPGKVTADKVVKLSSATTVDGQRVDIELRGGSVYVDGAKVTATDIKTSNGVIHVIDRVIMPSTQSIVELADEAGSFSTLLAAAKAAGLADLLGSEGPFTVFAPTDEAFAKLGSATINDLLKPSNRAKLAEILKYHVVPGRIYAGDAVAEGYAETAQGDGVRIAIADARLRVNDATIIGTDLEAANGVVHVIDTVLIPG